MKNRFIILMAITFILLSPLIYNLISSQPALEDIETSAEHDIHVAQEKSVSVDVGVSENYLFHGSAGANEKKRNVSQKTSNTAANINMASGIASEIGNEEAYPDVSKVDSDKSLTVTSSWFGNPEDAEYHYISLFIESEMLSDYFLNAVVCTGSACKLSFLTTSYEQQSELKTNLINILLQENRKFNVEFNEGDGEQELVLSITNG